MADPIAYALLVATLAVAAATDWRDGKVYNWLTYPAILAGLALWLVAGLLGAERGIAEALVACFAGIVPFAIIIHMGGLGGGDMKLMGAVGALSAMWQVVLATAIYGLVIAVVFAVALMVRHGLVRRTLGRLLGAAMMASAKVKPDVPDDSPKVPFAAAVALGGLLAGAEQMLGLQTPWAWLGP